MQWPQILGMIVYFFTEASWGWEQLIHLFMIIWWIDDRAGIQIQTCLILKKIDNYICSTSEIFFFSYFWKLFFCWLLHNVFLTSFRHDSHPLNIHFILNFFPPNDTLWIAIFYICFMKVYERLYDYPLGIL